MKTWISYPQSARDHAVSSIDVSEIDRRRLSLPKFPDRFDGRAITLSLVHPDIALAVETHAADIGETVDGGLSFKVSAKRLACLAAQSEAASSAPQSADPVMQRLSDALVAAEATHDAHSAILADALRLAILTRKITRQKTAERAGADLEGVAGHHARRMVRSLQKWRLQRVQQYVDDNLSAKISLQDLASVAGLSRMHFAAQFRAAVGMRPHEYLLKQRIERAQELLKQVDVPLVEVALTIGFQSQAHFTTVFKRFVGDTPNHWRSAYLAHFMPPSQSEERVS
jgi:AraC family transcriptional regulator